MSGVFDNVGNERPALVLVFRKERLGLSFGMVRDGRKKGSEGAVVPMHSAYPSRLK